MWERGEQKRVIREEEEQNKTINNKSVAFNDTILSFEQIFTVNERDKFKNRDLKRTNTMDKFDEIFDSMDISQRGSADNSKQSVKEEVEDLTDDDENDETIKSDDNSIIEAAKVLENHPDLAEEVFKELDTRIFEDEDVKIEAKHDELDSYVKEESENTDEHPDENQDDIFSEESESESQVCEAAVCDGLGSIIDPQSSESEDSGFDVESARRLSRSSSGSPVAMLAR